MRNKAVLLVCFGFLMSLFLIFGRSTHAEEIKSISYAQVMREAKEESPLIPTKLIIPSAKVSASIEQVGLEGEQMAVPQKNENVGWYKDGFRPGEKGNAVIDGHLDDKNGEPAVFWQLGLLRPNDDIYIQDEEGRKRHFVVTDVKEYPYEGVPMGTLFTNSLTSNLYLITCSGEYSSEQRNYSNRLVVHATLSDI